MSFGHLVNSVIDRRNRAQGGIVTATSQLPSTALGTGAPTFAAGAGDTLRATAGVAASVQYAAIQARVISSTEWALA